MAEVDLTAERVRELLDYDPETGVFTWRLNIPRCQYCGQQAGGPSDSRGYIKIMIAQRFYRAHRLAWLYVHGVWPSGQIDHINQNTGDNRIANLRVVSNAENRQNQDKLKEGSRSGFRGVKIASNGRFEARLTLNRKYHYLGTYATAEEASQAYRIARRKLHPFSSDAAP